MPIHQYIIEQRLTQAAQLLLEGDRNVSEIAAIVGYGKPSNLAAAFKSDMVWHQRTTVKADLIPIKVASDCFWVKTGRFWVGFDNLNWYNLRCG